MERRWTPGTWSIESRNTVTGGLVYEIYQKDPKDYRGIIAYMQYCEYIDGISKDETQANAQLIAAAPDLYEALSRAISEWDSNTNWRDGARKALSKARGETNV